MGAGTETYAEAKKRILSELKGLGWVLSDVTLKVPHATWGYGNGQVRLYFKPQALYLCEGRGAGLAHSRSLVTDYRGVVGERVAQMVLSNR